MIDIREGNILVIGAVEYPIKTVDAYATTRLNTRAFARMATVTASIKRSGESGNLRTAPENWLTGLKCTPLDPVRIRPNAIVTEVLNSPAKMLQTFITDGDGFVKLEVENIKQ